MSTQMVTDRIPDSRVVASMQDAQPVSRSGMTTTPTPFRRGFLLMLPLWAGAIPSGLVYGVVARNVGLSFLEAQLMSLVVFSAAAQISVVTLIGEGTATWLVVGTALALNAQLLLVSVAVGRQLRLERIERLVAGWLLTDAVYGVSAATGRLRLPVMLGAGVCMYLGWNLGTALGLAAGESIPDPQRLGIGLVIPLSFLAVLAPLLRNLTAVIVAGAAAISALLAAPILPGGIALLVAGAAGSAAGAAWVARSAEPR